MGDNVLSLFLSGDPRNILGVFLDCDDQNMYNIAVKSGIISSKYARNQFDLCPQRLLTNCDVNTECTVTLRQAVKATTSGGQGFFRRACGNGKKSIFYIRRYALM